MIGVEPGPFDSSGIGEPGHVVSVLETFDEGRKVTAIFEEKRRCRRRATNVKAGHGSEKFDPGDSLDGRIDRGERIDQADGDIVAIDIVAFDRDLAAGTHKADRYRACRIHQRRRKAGREFEMLLFRGIIKQHERRPQIVPGKTGREWPWPLQLPSAEPTNP